MDRAVEYFSLWYRLDREDRYLIWVTNDEDCLFCDQQSGIPSFHSRSHLEEYAKDKGIYLEKAEPILHDLDRIITWLNAPRAETLDCKDILNTWNLFLDVSNTKPDGTCDFQDQAIAATEIYEKLFRGNNLAAMTRPDEWYEPAWSEEGILALTRLLAKGLNMFRALITQLPSSHNTVSKPSDTV